MGKASVSNISVPPRCRHPPKCPCYGLFVSCGYPTRIPSFFRLPVLPACTVTATEARTLLPHHPLWSSDPPRLRPVAVLHYLRAWWPMPWIKVMTSATVSLWLLMLADKPWFSLVTAITHPPPQTLLGLRKSTLSLVLGKPTAGFESLSCTSLWIVSLRVSGIIVLGTRRGGCFL